MNAKHSLDKTEQRDGSKNAFEILEKSFEIRRTNGRNRENNVKHEGNEGPTREKIRDPYTFATEWN